MLPQNTHVGSAVDERADNSETKLYKGTNVLNTWMNDEVHFLKIIF